jgi:Zn-finger nucleic acid-binding protein
MLCPIDGENLVMTDRSGVEIDYCPKCRGVWLDRGELDKIIDRAQTQASAPVTAPTPQAARQPTYVAHDDDDDDRYKKKRKSSLLGELFDF